MNDSTQGGDTWGAAPGDARRDTRRPWPRASRTGAAVIAAALLALTAVACGGRGPASAGTGGSPQAAAPSNAGSTVAYSACMRSHGVPRFPDPDPRAGAAIPKGDAQQFGVSTAQFSAAQQACQPLLPTASLGQRAQQCSVAGNCPPALVQQMMTAGRTFARCMRSHGVPGWPDPTIGPDGLPEFNLLNVHGFDPNSVQIEQKATECQHVLPAGVRFGWTRPGSPG